MSERKVLNKYFPPDFDPAIPRRKQPKDAQHKVRLMTPYAMRCETCGDYIYKGKKFNARKETVEGESYHSIKIFRFYIKCPRCSAEITFKTDPKNTDYVAEHGASRNFEPWREEKIADVESKLQKEIEEENNPMKALENRTMDSKREMDILDALDEIRTRNARNERVDANELLDNLVEEQEVSSKTEQEILEEQDEKLAKSIFNEDYLDHTEQINEEHSYIKDLLSETKKSLILPTFGINKSSSTKTTTESIFDSKNTITKRKSSSSDLGIVMVKKKKPDILNEKNEKSKSHPGELTDDARSIRYGKEVSSTLVSSTLKSTENNANTSNNISVSSSSTATSSIIETSLPTNPLNSLLGSYYSDDDSE